MYSKRSWQKIHQRRRFWLLPSRHFRIRNLRQLIVSPRHQRERLQSTLRSILYDVCNRDHMQYLCAQIVKKRSLVRGMNSSLAVKVQRSRQKVRLLQEPLKLPPFAFRQLQRWDLMFSIFHLFIPSELLFARVRTTHSLRLKVILEFLGPSAAAQAVTMRLILS